MQTNKQTQLQFDETPPLVCVKSKKELYNEYSRNNKIGTTAFSRWWASLPFYGEIKGKRLLTPAQVQKVYELWGYP